jgi:hypothetical protein
MTMMKTKITLSDFRPKRIVNEPDNVREIFLGTLIGRATGVVVRTMPNQQTFEGLGGEFECNVVGSDEPVQSGVLFMPDTFINGLIGMLSDKTDSKTGEVIEPAASAVQIAFKIYSVKDGNAQGYTWKLESIRDPKAEKAADPLAELRNLVSAPASQARIAAPEKDGKKGK